MNSITTTASIGKQEIKRLLDNWGLWRDTYRWAELRTCYAPDATMVTTWFDGRATDFVEASIRASTSGTLVEHFMGPSTIEINGLRALAETRLMLLVRGELNGVEVDVTCYGRFFDRLVCIDGAWVILERMPIYEKDSLSAVDSRMAVDLDCTRLQTYPLGFRHLAYMQATGGATITMHIPAHNSEAQSSLYAAGKNWLKNV